MATGKIHQPTKTAVNDERTRLNLSVGDSNSAAMITKTYTTAANERLVLTFPASTTLAGMIIVCSTDSSARGVYMYGATTTANSFSVQQTNASTASSWSYSVTASSNFIKFTNNGSYPIYYFVIAWRGGLPTSS